MLILCGVNHLLITKCKRYFKLQFMISCYDDGIYSQASPQSCCYNSSVGKVTEILVKSKNFPAI